MTKVGNWSKNLSRNRSIEEYSHDESLLRRSQLSLCLGAVLLSCNLALRVSHCLTLFGLAKFGTKWAYAVAGGFSLSRRPKRLSLGCPLHPVAVEIRQQQHPCGHRRARRTTSPTGPLDSTVSLRLKEGSDTRALAPSDTEPLVVFASGNPSLAWRGVLQL